MFRNGCPSAITSLPYAQGRRAQVATTADAVVPPLYRIVRPDRPVMTWPTGQLVVVVGPSIVEGHFLAVVYIHRNGGGWIVFKYQRQRRTTNLIHISNAVPKDPAQALDHVPVYKNGRGRVGAGDDGGGADMRCGEAFLFPYTSPPRSKVTYPTSAPHAPVLFQLRCLPI